MKISVLIAAITYLKEQIPSIQRVTTYSSSRIVGAKKQEDLDALAQAGLSRIHIGLETGYGPLLDYMNKGATPEKHIDAGRKVKKAGISLSEYILFGLGGQKWTVEHATATADVINQINPDFIRSRRLVVPPNIPLYQAVQSGEFVQLTDEGIVREQQMFIGGLEGITSAYVSDHSYNPLMELNGQLPDDKQKMLATIDRFFALSEEDRKIFLLGRRIGVLNSLDQLYANLEIYFRLKKGLGEIESKHPGGFDELILEMLAAMRG